MSIERDIFKRRIFLPEKLFAYGFVRTENGYSFETVFYEGFIARLFVSEAGELDGKVFDPEFSEEYGVFRLERAEGAFVTGMKQAYISLLSDIAENTTFEKMYVFDQSNELSERIFRLYGIRPEFMWEKFPRFGVYRNADSRKWFAIIMNISSKKIFPIDENGVSERAPFLFFRENREGR